MIISSEDRAALAADILEHRHELASAASERIYAIPFWQLRYGAQGRVTCLNDNLKNTDVFALSIRNGSPMIADTHVLWLRDIYINLGMCTVFLMQAFSHLEDAARDLLAEEPARAFIEVMQRAQAGLAHQKETCKTLAANQDKIVEAVVAKMYSMTPYWSVRYGDAGRQSCSIDTYYNLAFMADAIETDNLKGINIHTTWMRNFLISRGMCTKYYLDAWTELVKAALDVLPPQDHAAVRKVYDAVVANLDYDHTFAKSVANQYKDIMKNVMAAHYDRQPDLQQRLNRTEYGHHVSYMLSFVVDAAVQKKPETFTRYMEWLQSALLPMNLTPADLAGLVQALKSALPADAPPEVHQWLLVNASAPASNGVGQGQASAIAAQIERQLHNPDTLWIHLQPNADNWRSTVHSAVSHTLQNADGGNLRAVLDWIITKAGNIGASRAYLLAFTTQLRAATKAQLPAESAARIDNALNTALENLAEEDPALTLLQIPELVDPIIESLQQYSPYWQAKYQRRDRETIVSDTHALIGFLADDLMEINSIGFPVAADSQRHYLLSQGICTAYYQQMLDLTMDVLENVLDTETFDRASILLDAAAAAMESDNAHTVALAEVQDHIVDFVISYVKEKYPEWVNNYPGGWDDATNDMYYWLGYLTDAVTFNKPGILSNHIVWLRDYARQQGNNGEHIHLTLLALGHAIKQHLPEHMPALLNIMRTSLVHFK